MLLLQRVTYLWQRKLKSVIVSVMTVASPIGVDSGTLDPSVYQLTVDTFDSYVAIVNVSESSLLGQWQLRLRTYGGPYTIRITAVSDLDFVYTLYRLDPSSNFGFVSFEGNPLAGTIITYQTLPRSIEKLLNHVVMFKTFKKLTWFVV